MKPPVAAQPSMSMLSRLLTALEHTEGVEAATLHPNGPQSAPGVAFAEADRVAKNGDLGACLQVYIEAEHAVLLDDVGDGRCLRLEGASGHYGRWRHAVERHRPLIGRMHEEVA